MAAHGQSRIDPRFDRGEQKLLEPASLCPRERFVPNLAVSRAPPQLLGSHEQPHGLGGVASCQLAPAFSDELFESEHVGGIGRDIEQVAGGACDDHVVWSTGAPETLAQSRDGRTKSDFRSLPVTVTPERVNQPVDRNDQAPIDQQPGDERTGFHPAEVDRSPAANDFDRAEDTNLGAGRVRGARGRVQIGTTPRHLGSHHHSVA